MVSDCIVLSTTQPQFSDSSTLVEMISWRISCGSQPPSIEEYNEEGDTEKPAPEGKIAYFLPLS
jgi:hypothetical protein